MRSARSRQSSSPLGTAGLVAAAVGVGALVMVGGLWLAGMPLPFGNREPDYRGFVRVPIATRPIPAFTRITRDYLLIAESGTPSLMPVREDLVQRSRIITSFEKIVGRVVDHDKMPGYPFTEDDYLPVGTREGIVAAIPAGKRAMTIEATKIEGIHALRVGDHVDLVSSQPVDLAKVLGSGGSSLQVGLLKQTKQAQVRVLVQNGLLVSPVKTRAIPISTSSLASGNKNGTKLVQEVMIAVDPEEIAPLTEALAVESRVTCVARSGLPDDPGLASVTPAGPNPIEQVAPVERILGGKREVMFVPRTTYAPGDTRSMVTIPLVGKALPEGAVVTPEHLVDLATNRPRLVSLRAGDVRRLGLITDPARIVGRTLGRKKNPDSAFSETDFAPPAGDHPPRDGATNPPPAAASTRTR